MRGDATCDLIRLSRSTAHPRTAPHSVCDAVWDAGRGPRSVDANTQWHRAPGEAAPHDRRPDSTSALI